MLRASFFISAKEYYLLLAYCYQLYQAGVLQKLAIGHLLVKLDICTKMHFA